MDLKGTLSSEMGSNGVIERGSGDLPVMFLETLRSHQEPQMELLKLTL